MTNRAVPTRYPRTCTVVRVVDGDTLHVQADMGCDIQVSMTLRLYGLNAPEHDTPGGPSATDFTRRWVDNHGPVFELLTVKDRREKFGRYLADLAPMAAPADPGAPTLCAALLASDHAVPYFP